MKLNELCHKFSLIYLKGSQPWCLLQCVRNILYNLFDDKEDKFNSPYNKKKTSKEIIGVKIGLTGCAFNLPTSPKQSEAFFLSKGHCTLIMIRCSLRGLKFIIT